jgi:hypothetical protein
VPNSSRALLDAAYTELGYEGGALRTASSSPKSDSESDWIEKGDWLALAEKVGAEKVFFVNEYPVIVFAEQKSSDASAWLSHFNSAWCMARPQLLFLARDGELAVLDLTKPPARAGEARDGNGRLLEIVEAASQVQAKLHKYRREQVESGRLFEEERFGPNDRADRALIRDLGKVRKALLDNDLAPNHAHALIGRSIFVRYLEDRGVLTDEYFRKVARAARRDQRAEWEAALTRDPMAEAAVDSGRDIYYPRVLKNKLFTYALFRSLADHFNGDMFPVNSEEEIAVNEKHLGLLRKFFLGDIEGGLFFFAYRFDIIPIELISSIYEKFYSLRRDQHDQQRDDGSYYTPAALVEFVLSHALTAEQLQKRPCVLDPACGSGIFLVESFRRIIRYQYKQTGQRPRFDTLRAILRDQIRGIDINREAIRVAAFSLYLAMLHYLKPPDILQHQLPSLTYTHRARRDPDKHLDILLVSDAFGIEQNLSGAAALARFGKSSADVVVGNPPWGSPSSDDELTSDGGAKWCEARELSVGDKERSQSFVHRTMDFLASGGRAGLLLSTGIFFKRHPKTQRFRQQWLEAATLRSVFNFAAVRHAFFRPAESGKDEGRGAIAPFVAVVFDKVPPESETVFSYWSAKETAFVTRVQAVILNRADSCHARQSRFVGNDQLWKIYWWGTHRDEALIARLQSERTLGEEFDPSGENFRIGFLEAKKDQSPSGWLRKYPEFPTSAFVRYGPLPKGALRPPPKKVKRRCEQEIYKGPRLLIKRGIGTDGIVARFEEESFSFRHSIYAVTVPAQRVNDAQLALGVMWSSLIKYYLFMTSGSWGLWHDEVLKGTFTGIPLRLNCDSAVRDRIVGIVRRLRSVPDMSDSPLFQRAAAHSQDQLRHLERELDDAVFELFGLTPEERSRVLDFCETGLDLFYNGMASDAVRKIRWPVGAVAFGRTQDVCIERTGDLTEYLRVFLGTWEPRLVSQAGNLRWRIIQSGDDAAVIAAIFQTESAQDQLEPPDDDDEHAWSSLLQQLQRTSRQTFFASRVYVDGFVRVVSKNDIIILKRNERRLWTASAASEDAEATMLMAMMDSSPPRKARPSVTQG